MKILKRISLAFIALVVAVTSVGTMALNIENSKETVNAEYESEYEEAETDSEEDTDTVLRIGSVKVEQGSTNVEVPVRFKSGTGFAGTGIKYYFDSDITLSDVTTGDSKAGDPIFAANETDVSVGTATTSDISGKGTIYNLVFTIPKDAPVGTVYDITGSIDLISDVSGDDLDANIYSGSITISDDSETIENSQITFEIGNITVESGTTEVYVPVELSQNSGIIGTGIKYTYDSDITFLRVENGDLMEYEPVSASSSGSTAITTSSIRPITDTGTLYYMVFEIPTNTIPGTVYSITASVSLLTDSNNNDTNDYNIIDGSITVAGFSTMFTIGSVTVQPGTTEVSVPVTVSPNAGFVATGIEYAYDRSISLLGEERGDIGSDSFINDSIEISVTSVAAITTASSGAITDDGIIYYLKFSIPDDAEPGTVYSITGSIDSLYDADNNETTDYYIVDGSITIDEYDVSEDGS
jgi:hypothetical protein